MHDTERKTLFLISAELHLIICSRCQNWGRKSFSSVLGLQSNCGERFRKRGKEKRANQRMPDSSCMGDESRIQNVPSLADVKSHKMAHYRDRKGARWSNKPHVSLKQNDKGRGTERWHCNIPTFQLLLKLRFWPNNSDKKEAVVEKISYLNDLSNNPLCRNRFRRMTCCSRTRRHSG